MSAVLDAVRKKYPAYAEVPDAQLTHALGSKYPVYREQDPDFDSEYMAVAQQAFRGPTESELALAEPRTPGGAQPPPALTPEPDTQSEAAQFWEDVNEPMWEIVKPLSEEEHKWLATEMTPGELRKVGMQESLGGLVNFFTSPLGVSTFGIGALPKMAQRAIALAFATTMAKHGGEAAGELAGELDKPEEQRDQIKIGRLIGDTAQMTGFSALGAIGAGGGRLTKPGLEWWRQEIKPLEMARQLVESPVVKANREAYIDAQARAGGKPIVETSTQPDRASTWAVDRAVEEFNARKAAEQRAQPQPKPTDLEYEGGELTDYRSPITDQTLPVPQADTSKPTAAIEPPKSSPPAAPVGTGDLPVKPEGRRQKAETASAMLGDYETLKEWNKAALAREVADQAPPGFYQLSILTQQRVRAMSAEEITKRFAAMMQTIKEVSGKQGADRATDLSKDAAYRLNSAVLYQEALKRGITRPIATLDEYVKSGQFAKQAKTETPDDIQEAAQTFTRTDALEEFRSRGMNVTTEMADLWAESQNLNSRFLDMRGRHEPGVTEVQKKLSTMDRRLDELAAAANPAIYKEGQELEYRMFPRDKPRKVVITGTSFDTINGRTYKFQEVGRPDAHFPGARAEQLGPVGIRNIDSEIARAQASAGAARANFNNMGKWRDLKSEDARRYWRQAKLEASGAEVELNKLIEEKKAIEARSKLTAPQPSSLVPRPSPPAGASPGQPPSNPPSLAMEGGAEAGPTPGTGSKPSVEGRGSRGERQAAKPGDVFVGQLFDVPKAKGQEGERAQIIRMLEKIEDIDPRTGEPIPKDGMEERAAKLRARLGEIERAKLPEHYVNLAKSFEAKPTAQPPAVSGESPKPQGAGYEPGTVTRTAEGRWVLAFDKPAYDALEPRVKQTLASYFNWSPSRKAWISKTAKDDFWSRSVARDAKLREVGEPWAAREIPPKPSKPQLARETLRERAARLDREMEAAKAKEAQIQAERDRMVREAQEQAAAEGWLTVPVPDVARSAEVKRQAEAKLKEIQGRYNQTYAERKKLEDKVISKSGPRWNRGQIKKSAPGKLVALYNELGNKLQDIDAEATAVKREAEGDVRAVRMAELARRVNDPKQTPLMRYGARSEMFTQIEAQTPEALSKLLEAEARAEIQRRIPDATQEEISKLTGRVMREAELGSDLESSFRLDPTLRYQSARKQSLFDAMRNEFGLWRGEITPDALPVELVAELEAIIPGWKFSTPDFAKGRDITHADIARIKSELGKARDALSAQREQERLAAEALKAEEEKQIAIAEEETKKLVDEAQQVADSASKQTAKAIKEELLTRIEAAIAKAPEDLGANGAVRRIAIGVPGDGVFVVENTKKSLKGLLERANKIATTKGDPEASRGPGQVSLPKAGGWTGPKVNQSTIPEWLEKNVSGKDDARAILTYAWSDGKRVVAADGVKIVEITPDKPPKAVNDLEFPFPIEKSDLILANADQAQSLVSTADLWRASRMAQKMDWTEGNLTPWVELFTDGKGALYAEAVDTVKDFASFGAKSKAMKSLGKYNPDYIETLAEAARKLGHEQVAVGVKLHGDDGGRLLAMKAPRLRAAVMEIRFTEAKAEKPAVVKPELEVVEPPKVPIIGMGGATPGEFRGGSATSIKNAQVDVERTRRGLPAAMQPAKRDFGQVWDEAMARVDADPAVQDRLITELKEKPRALTDLEDALLLHRQIDLQNAYARSTRELAAAYEDAGRFPNRLEDVERWKAETQRLSDALLELYDVGKAAGTATGRGLNARKMLANEDFTLAEMEVGLRAAKEGRPLTDAERSRLAELEANYRDLDAKFNEYREKVETERATRMSTEAIEELKRKVASQPTYDPRILKTAEEIVVKLETQAQKSDAWLNDYFSRTELHSGVTIDPGLVYHLGVKGAAMIARKGLDFARFSAELISAYGEKVKPYLQAAWERANLHLDNEGAKYGDKAPQVKNLLRKRDEGSRRENIVDGLKNAAKEGQPLDLQGDFIRKLCESFIRGGIRDVHQLITAVHEVLKAEFDPAITRRETMDAISGYGKFKPLNPDQVKATLRDLKGQMQQIAKLEDILARKPLPKTGIERRVPSDQERRLLQQVNEAKRRHGVVVSDPARQLKSALNAVETRLKNSISDLEWQLANQEKIVKTRTPAPSSPETQVLELRRDELRRQFDEMFPRQPLTDSQRASIAKRHLERNIAELEARIQGGDISIRQGRKIISTPELEALRAQRDALKAQHQELIDTLAPERRQQADLAALKARLASQTAYYQDRMARGDFSKRPPPREIPMDRPALDLLAKRERVRTEYQRMKIHARLEARTRAQKLYGNLKEIINLPRTVWTAYDVSAVGRQGLVIGAAHPIRAARSIGPMFRALASEQAALRYEQQILNRPNAALYRQSKLYLAPHEALTLSAMEEQIMSRFAHRIPGVRPSNRAFITYLNLLRADSFDAMFNTMVKRNGNVSAAELQAISNYINAATGRGNIYKAAIAGEFLATVFFSPRLVASRFQLLAGEPLMRGSWQTRRLIAQEYAQSLAGLGVIITLGLLAGATVEGDPRSSDFGKLKFGDTRVDVMAGLTQNAVLLSRLASGETKTLAGDVRPIRGPDVPYGRPGADDVIKQFLRTKLAPVPGMGLNVLRGENVLGEPVQPLQTMKEIVQSKSIGEAATRTGKAAWETLAPLSMRDIYEAMQRNGVPAGAALGVLSLFGAGLQVHEQHPAAEAVVSEKMRKVRGGSPEQRRELRENLVRTYQATAKTNAAFAKALEDQAQRIRLEQAFARTNKLQGAFNSPAGSTNRLLRAVGR